MTTEPTEAVDAFEEDCVPFVPDLSVAHDIATEALAQVTQLLDDVLPVIIRQFEQGTPERAELRHAHDKIAGSWAYLQVATRMLGAAAGADL